MLDLHNFKLPKLKEEEHDRKSIKKEFFKQKGKAAVKNLKKNNFEAYYLDSIEEARKFTLSLIPDNGIIGCGDSHTIFALGLEQELEKKNCVAIPHTCAVNNYAMENNSPGWNIVGSKQEMRDILMQYLVANVFILGANAITIDGQIINIDGAGNRIAGSLYGSDRIIVVAGANKLVKDLNAGLERLRFVAAPMNNIKFGNDLACNTSGVCNDCRSEERNCNITNIIHKRPQESDFHVIIIGEELGF
ncbi:MAG: lactate utilization protein [Bacillota bacterium]